jgi:hypothetical protein
MYADVQLVSEIREMAWRIRESLATSPCIFFLDMQFFSSTGFGDARDGGAGSREPRSALISGQSESPHTGAQAKKERGKQKNCP